MPDNQKRVLIVEDDDLLSQMYLASLATANFQVRLEKDGLSGWDALQTFVPSLIILDIMLPKLNGLEILAKIRADARLKSVPVIVMSSLASDIDKKRATEAGATAYWVKNEVNMVDFAGKINAFIK